jgi:probable F420-dependent oxidoreductase
VRVGAVFPQGRLLLDRGAAVAFAQAAQDLGYHHLFCYDHVLGVEPVRYVERWPDRMFAYDAGDPFHEPLTLAAFLTAAAPELEFLTGVLILPQRQTALVAKQAAEVDFLSGGKLRLGLGSGWNEAEYEALGVPWARRGRRLDEQIEVLRLLWTQDVVTYRGEFHVLDNVGLNPLPAQQPIPIWTGGASEAAHRRAARLADGYLSMGHARALPDASGLPATFERIRALRREAGLAVEGFGIEVRPLPASPDDWPQTVTAWAEVGVTHLSVTTLPGATAASRGSAEWLRLTPAERARAREIDTAKTTVDEHIAELEAARTALAPWFTRT